MHRSHLSLLGGIVLANLACAPNWHAEVQADTRQVARALDDPVDLGPAQFDPATVPDIRAPHKLRPCCAFGQDLHAKVGPVPVPFYENANVLSPREVGPHGYDKGDLTREHNGLVYTCRGGFIDIAHIRDHADRTLYLALEIARALPDGVTITMPEEGTLRRVIVKPLPAELLARHGRWAVATTLASWAAYQLSVWHEVVTWYGWESVKGVSEKLSAFSPEDLYSNALGVKLAAGIVLSREVRTREEYEAAMTAWITEALRRLEVVEKVDARAAMQAVDGLWWDASKRLPDWRLVTRRALDFESPVSGWLVADAVADGPVALSLRRTCPKQPPPLPLQVPQTLGDAKIAELAVVELEFSSWIPEHFPLPIARGKSVTQADFTAIVADIRQEGAKELGPDFDQPRAPAAKLAERQP